jgi:glucose dehydrogenase
MSQVKCLVKRPAVASVTLLVAASLAAGCGSSGKPSTAGCSSKPVQPAASGAAAGWTLPGANLQNTRDVASPITSSNVSQLGVAWCVPLESTGATRAAGFSNGYATTPVVVNGVVYTQDLESNVMAIKLATGKVLWTHNYNSLNGTVTCTRSTPPPARSC